MTTEDKLKNFILSRFNSVREFTQVANIKYSTFDSMLKRGLATSNVSNVIKICKELGISADALGEGKIIPINSYRQNVDGLTDLQEILDTFKNQLNSCSGLTIDGKLVKKEIVDSIIGAMEVSLEIAKRNIK